MAPTYASLSVGEKKKMVEILDLILEHLFAHKDAVAEGKVDHAKELETKIHDLFQEKKEIEKMGCGQLFPQ